jgi:hypothetical protein
MHKFRNLTAAAIMLASLGPAPVHARDLAVTGSASLRHITQRAATRTVWYYDGRDDVRDFPTNGFFPGDFAANPANAAIGAAGIFGSTPSPLPWILRDPLCTDKRTSRDAITKSEKCHKRASRRY